MMPTAILTTLAGAGIVIALIVLIRMFVRASEQPAILIGDGGIIGPDGLDLTNQGLIIGRLKEAPPEFARMRMLALPGKEVSRPHASIVRKKQAFLISDHSQHGTFVNGERIGIEHPLNTGDKIRIGAHVLTFVDPKQKVESLAGLTGQYAFDDEVVGKGGLSTVFRAQKSGKFYAVKVPRNAKTLSIRRKEEFLKEGENTQRFMHSAIIGIHEVGNFPSGIPYIAMELFEGHTLRSEMQKSAGQKRKLREDRLKDIVLPIVDALNFVHGQGFIHGDIKPENILISPQGKVKLIDFGIAMKYDPPCTSNGGTIFYRSPESFTGKPIGPKTDFYALGCVMYEMLVGVPPFVGTGAQIADGHQKIVPKSLAELGVPVSKEMDSLVMLLLEKDPDSRPEAHMIISLMSTDWL